MKKMDLLNELGTFSSPENTIADEYYLKNELGFS
jgi:hypothetical protein